MGCKITVIASGKGGVGKSTLTVNLAACLSKRGKKVLAVDADLEMRNLDLVAGMQDGCLWDSGDVFAGKCPLEQAFAEHVRFPGFFLLPGPMRPRDIGALSGFLAEKAEALAQSGDFDHILIDCPSGMGENVSVFFRHGVSVIVAATPDITSVRDAQKVASAAFEKGVPDASLVVNRVRAKSIEKGRAPDIDFMMDSVSLRLLGIIPEDRRTSEASFTGVLVSEISRSRSKKAYENIAARIDGEYRELYRFWK